MGNPKKELYLDRDSEFESKTTGEENVQGTDKVRTARRAAVRNSRLSAYAKASLQRIGGAVDANYNACESVFLTGTFPGDDYASQSAIASQSAWIVHRLKAWIYDQIGANVSYYVWEFQKRGTLHLHYVVLIPCPIARSQIIEGFRREWIRLIDGASKRSGCNLFIGRGGRDFFLEKELLQIYAQECYKSAAAYLSKYLSKHKYSEFPPPARMWGATREAKNLVASSLISLEICHKTIRDAEDIAYQLEAESDTPREKTRFFRHRFSQGFTILLYNDTFRMNLSEMVTAEMNRRMIDYLGKVSTVWDKCKKVGLSQEILEKLSKPGYSELRSMLHPGSDDVKPLDPADAVCALLEIRALVADSGLGGYRARFAIRESLSVIITEMIEAHDLSILRKVEPDNDASDSAVVDEAPVVKTSNSRKQLRLQGT